MRPESEVMIALHIPEGKVLNTNQRVGVHQLARGLMPEVAALIRDVIVTLGDLAGGFVPTTRALPATSQAALSDTQLPQRRPEVTGGVNEFAILQSQHTVQANIDADLARFVLDDLRLRQFNLESDTPLPHPTLNHYTLDLGVIRDPTVVLKLDLAHVLDVEPGSAVIVEPQLASVAVRKLDALEARESRRLAFLDTPEEGTKRLVETAQGRLHTGEVELAQTVGVLTAQRAEVLGLRRVGNALTGL